MLKRFLLVIVLLGFIASPVFAVTVDWHNVWYENCFYDSNFNNSGDEQNMYFNVFLADVADPSSVGVSVRYSVFSRSLPFTKYRDSGLADYFTSAFPSPPLSNWETTYNFSIGGVSSSPSITIPDGALTLLPYAIPEFNGGMASWNSVSPVAGDKVEYKLRIYNFENGNIISTYFWDSGILSGTSYDFSFLGPGEYAIRLAAREMFGDNFLNRSTSFSYFNKPVPEPATMLLFGAGLVGLVGFGRKRFKK